MSSPFRKDFPIFEKRLDPEKIIYFDSASTTLKPKIVIDAIANHYEYETANVSRSTHFLSEKVTILFEESREKVASFIKASPDEIVFTYNCTDSLNMLAKGLIFEAEDEVIIPLLEHHSNYLPWKTRAKVKIVRIDEKGLVDLNHLENLLNDKTKLISFTYAPNTSGNIQPAKKIVDLAKQKGILTCIDLAQAISHMPINLLELDCDFAAFSGHKMFSPSGVGVLYVNKRVQHLLNPTRIGGSTVDKVSVEDVLMRPFPYNFEGGTPNIEGVIGLGKAVDYISANGFSSISKHLDTLEKHFKSLILKSNLIVSHFPISNAHLPIFTFCPRNSKTSIAYISRILSDAYKILVRDGMHCAQLLYHSQNSLGGIRVSLHIYNTTEEIDRFGEALENLRFLLM